MPVSFSCKPILSKGIQEFLYPLPGPLDYLFSRKFGGYRALVVGVYVNTDDRNIFLNCALNFPSRAVRVPGLLAQERNHPVTPLDPRAALRLPPLVKWLFQGHVGEVERRVVILGLAP